MMAERKITASELTLAIIEEYRAAKGFRSVGAFALFAMEAVMLRTKVLDLHEQLLDARIGEVKNGQNQ